MRPPGSCGGDERGQDLVAAGERPAAVVRPEQRAQEEEQRELGHHDEPRQDEADRGVLLAPRDQQPLHEVVVGAVGGEREEHPADDAAPERERLVQVEREVEDLRLAGGGRGGERRGDAALRQRLDHRDQAHERAEQVDEHLDGVGPDRRRDAAFLGVHDHGDAEDEDPHPLPLRAADGDREHERGRVEADAVTERPVHQEDRRGGAADGAAAEPLLENLVGRVDVAPEVRGQEQGGDQDAGR